MFSVLENIWDKGFTVELSIPIWENTSLIARPLPDNFLFSLSASLLRILFYPREIHTHHILPNLQPPSCHPDHAHIYKWTERNAFHTLCVLRNTQSQCSYCLCPVVFRVTFDRAWSCFNPLTSCLYNDDNNGKYLTWLFEVKQNNACEWLGVVPDCQH